MSERFSVKIKVISQKGICGAGHKVGDEFIISRHTPPGFCVFAYSAIDPDVRALMFGGKYPWSKDPEIYVGCCPDSTNPVIFELRRISFQE